MRFIFLPIILIALSGADIEKAVMADLNSHFPLTNSQYACDFSHLYLGVLPDYDSVTVDGYGKDVPKGQSVVRLSFFHAGERIHKSTGSIKIGILKTVLITTGPIKAGEQFTPDKLGTETRDIATLDEMPLEFSSMLQGKVATHFIPSGRILTASLAQEPPAIHIGDHVEIQITKGPVLLSTDGVARENGYTGKTIKVMNSDSRKLISAVVIDSTTVAMGIKEAM
jgi:flagella basal body P-ring formation protein FlgA